MLIIQKEIDCIKKSRKIEIADVQKKIDEFITVKKFINHNFSPKEIKKNIRDLHKFSDYLTDLLKTILAFIFLPIIALIIYFYSRHEINEIKNELTKLQSRLGKKTPVPNTKNLTSLWEMYGLQNLKSTHSRWFNNLSDSKLQIELISDWLKALYGARIYGSIDVMHEFESMKKSCSNANEGYYKDRSSPHYSYAPLAQSIVEELSERLPDYTNEDAISDYAQNLDKTVEHNGELYRDDRMYVFYVCECTINVEKEKTCYTIHHNNPPSEHKWCLVTFRNTERYPAIRADGFDSWNDAMAYSNNAEPTTPLVSLGGHAPDKILPIDEYRDWKTKNAFQEYNYKKMYMPESEARDGDYAETVCMWN